MLIVKMDSPSPKPVDKKPKTGGTEWWWILLFVFVVFFFIVIGFFFVRSFLNSNSNIKNIRVNNSRVQ